MPSAEIELIDPDTIGVRFAFDPTLVSQLRALSSRRWNPKLKRWEIHIAHLAEVMRIFYMHPDDAPEEVLEIYRDKWIRKSLRVIVSNATTRLSGACIPMAEIDKVTSFPVAGHQYSLKFIEGAWDGKRHLFNRGELAFPSGLLPRVLTILDEKGVEYDIVDERPCVPKQFNWKCLKLNLRPYQKEAVRAAVKNERGVLQLATGSGKTLIAAKIISRLKRPSIFFVHTKDLLLQSRRALGEALEEEVGQIGDGVVDIKSITVATVQTAVRVFGGKIDENLDEDVSNEDETPLSGVQREVVDCIENAAVAIFDECHHVPADTFYTIAMKTESARFRFGLSATPYRADRQDMLLEAALGPTLYRANSSRLIQNEYLVAPKINFLRAPGGATRREHAKYRDIYRRFVIENEERHELIAKKAAALSRKGKSALILVNEVDHGERLLEKCNGAQFIQGSDSASRREQALADLESKKLKILIATTLADEGLDIPTLDAVILAGAGRSETKALQRIGRALRPAPGKQGALIIDIYDQAPYLIDQAKKRLEIYRTETEFEIDDGGLEPTKTRRLG